ncbi:MAG: hypothetical protein ABI609_01710 [Acidobacteriota bacterium]
MLKARTVSCSSLHVGRAFAVVGLLLLAACDREHSPAPPVAESYAPGLGEIMTLQQMRHIKLWFAGQSGNWQLADYEVTELGEGFDDVVKFHPTHKDSPVAPKDAIPRLIPGPLAAVRTAIEHRDAAEFVRAYDALTAACNGCHQATNFGFNVVGRPQGNPYTNQVFEPAH